MFVSCSKSCCLYVHHKSICLCIYMYIYIYITFVYFRIHALARHKVFRAISYTWPRVHSPTSTAALDEALQQQSPKEMLGPNRQSLKKSQQQVKPTQGFEVTPIQVLASLEGLNTPRLGKFSGLSAFLQRASMSPQREPSEWPG